MSLSLNLATNLSSLNNTGAWHTCLSITKLSQKMQVLWKFELLKDERVVCHNFLRVHEEFQRYCLFSSSSFESDDCWRSFCMFFGISHGTLGMFQKTSAASNKIYRVWYRRCFLPQISRGLPIDNQMFACSLLSAFIL